MTDESFPTPDEDIDALLRRGAATAWLVYCVEEGFDEQQARTVLDSPALMTELAHIGADITVGAGLFDAARQPTSLGRLNGRLLRQVKRSRRSSAAADRYELGVWLKQSHPGTGIRANPFDETLLDLELGALAWENVEALGGLAAVREALDAAGPAILSLARRIDGWSGWRRSLADAVLLSASQAFVATHPDAPETPTVARIAAALQTGEPVASALDDDLVTRRPMTQRDLALAAGEQQPGRPLAKGSVVVNPALVEPRSVAPDPEGSWEVVEDDEDTILLRIRVSVGDSPAEALTAYVTLDGEADVVDLPRNAALYLGALRLSDVPNTLRVEATSPGLVPSAPHHDDDVAALRAAIDKVIRERHARAASYDDGSIDALTHLNRPFLCELVAWDPQL